LIREPNAELALPPGQSADKGGSQRVGCGGSGNEVHSITEVTAMSVEVRAPMPGKILEVLVKVGDQVKEDDEVVMLEAMKMENPIYAPADGTVKEIKVKANDSVETEQLMIVIE
jgi:biotin carboxyl carrier protein